MNQSAIALSLIWLATLVSAALGFCSNFLLARILSVEDFGALATAVTFIAIVGTIGGLGLGAFWLRIFGVEGASAQRWIGPSLRLAAIATTASVVIASIAPQYVFSSVLPGLLVYLLLPAAIVQIVLDLLQSKYQLEEDYARVSLVQLLPNLSKALAACAAYSLSLDAFQSAILMSAGALSLGIAVLLSHRHSALLIVRVPAYRHSASTVPRPTPQVQEVAIGTLPFALATISYPIYFQGGLLSLGAIGSSHDAGLFGAGFLVITATYLLPAVTFQKFLTARMQWWAQHDPAKFHLVLKRAVLFLATAGLALSAMIHLNAEIIVSVIFGPRFAEASKLLSLLAFAIPFRYYSSAIGSALLTGKSVLARANCEVFAAVVTASFTAVLYSRFGATAAVIATVSSEIFLAIAYSLLIKTVLQKSLK